MSKDTDVTWIKSFVKSGRLTSKLDSDHTLRSEARETPARENAENGKTASGAGAQLRRACVLLHCMLGQLEQAVELALEDGDLEQAKFCLKIRTVNAGGRDDYSGEVAILYFPALSRLFFR